MVDISQKMVRFLESIYQQTGCSRSQIFNFMLSPARGAGFLIFTIIDAA